MTAADPDRDETLESLLASILKPLQFAAKDNFAHIDKVRNLGLIVPNLAARALCLSDDHETQSLLHSISLAFHSLETKTSSHKRRIVSDALKQIDAIRCRLMSGTAISDASNPAANAMALIEYFQKPVLGLKGIGPATAEKLSRLGIETAEDLLYCIPRSYDDRRFIQTIGSVTPGQSATIRGTVRSSATAALSQKVKMFSIVVDDSTGSITAKWFRIPRPYQTMLSRKYPRGTAVLLSGSVSSFKFQHEMHHPDITAIDADNSHTATPGILPVYPLTEMLQQHSMRTIVRQQLPSASEALQEYMPLDILRRNNLVSLREAFLTLHAPPSSASCDHLLQCRTAWHRRIIFDELFLLQIVLAMRRHGTSLESGISFAVENHFLDATLARLPFTLTSSQHRVLREIVSDMQKPHPMNRLVQGDVGCGKTVIALIACMIAAANGYQSAIMAPTEILAGQHYATALELLGHDAATPVLLSGSMPKAARAAVLNAISSGQARIVIGTHALIQETVHFQRLGLVIADEQHRFGVVQRADFRKKGTHPDVLVMTATPIPRTLGLTLYGDLDLSVVDELPPGRIPVTTRVYSERKRPEVYRLIGEAISRGEQIFIIYPLVKESEKIDLMDATRMSMHLQQDIFPDCRIGLVHGQMSAHEKNTVMQDFKHKQVHILVATTVVEVGIDVPNASLMVIEHAERFGLSQLHQLRGRIGRGREKSLCILLAQYAASSEARQRLETMEKTSDGFAIAEADFTLRGPGEFLGTRQSGAPDFRLAHIGRDVRILQDARKSAFELIEHDPNLARAEHAGIRAMLLHRWKGHLELAGIG